MQILKVLPKNLLSRVVGELASIESPEVVSLAARDWFIKQYKINMDEAELPLSEYPSVAKLFTRKLKPGARPIVEGIVHPCDAKLTCAEVIDGDSLIQAKGRHYSLAKLLGARENELLDSSGSQRDLNSAAVLPSNSLKHSQKKELLIQPSEFLGGTHLVYYLCPTDYHRVHAPVAGEVVQVVHIPGQLWPVNDWSVSRIPELFAVNERVIFYLRTALGPVALIMVGATNVGKISVSFDEEIVTNQSRFGSPFIKSYVRPIKIEKGQELGIFHMGSTVVMLYGPGQMNVLPATGPVRLGESV